MTRHLLSIILVSICLGGTSFSGQKKNDDNSSDSMDAMSVEELRSYQGYFFANGGRDPMTMRFPTDLEKGLGRKDGPLKAPTLEEQGAMLRSWLDGITDGIKSQDYEAALEVSGEAITVIDNEWPPLKSENTELVRMSDSIRNLARLAGRLKNQQDIAKEFLALDLRVDGVVWSPIDAKAVVNGVTHSAGELLINERKQGDLRVEMIEEQGVVFQYRGMRFQLPVQLYAPMQANVPVPGQATP